MKFKVFTVIFALFSAAIAVLALCNPDVMTGFIEKSHDEVEAVMEDDAIPVLESAEEQANAPLVIVVPQETRSVATVGNAHDNPVTTNDVTDDDNAVSGELKKWHRVTVYFEGPHVSETDNAPNPFLDYRLQVIFTGPSNQIYNVPGFFDGDGKGNGTGNIWKAHFAPDEAGEWHYVASFRRGPGIAVELEPRAGRATDFDGAAGVFTVADRDPDAPGFLRWGRLEYVGGHYLKFRDGPYWIKGGTDSPENFLAYEGFDNTIGNHTYAAHVGDWQEGDPVWGDGHGKGIIGALNYLASEHVNSIYFLTMNIGGDGKDVWPFAGDIDPDGSSSNDNLHYDVSKLQQWEIVFAHAQRNGILLHFVLSETEEANKLELDDATLGVERKLYYRELVARFGHHMALQWNISEEFNESSTLLWTTADIDEFASYIRAVDPYDHPITAHGEWSELWGHPLLDLTSYQWYPELEPGYLAYGAKVEADRASSQLAGRPIPICIDEPDTTRTVDNNSHAKRWPFASGHSFQRKNLIWPAYLSGSGCLEFILEERLETDDFRNYENMWRYTWYARRFLQEHLPFWEMVPADHLLSDDTVFHLEGGQVFAKAGEVYAVYLPRARTSGTLDLSDVEGCFSQRWYNPRTGQFEGSTTSVVAGGFASLGEPPRPRGEDWTILLKVSFCPFS